MARWINAKDATAMLELCHNQVAVHHHYDKKMRWNRRIKKEKDGRLYVNIDDYRSANDSNALTKERLGLLYYELSEAYGPTNLSKMLRPFLPNQSYQSIYMYFNYFNFKNRRSALKYYLALRALKRSLVWEHTPMTSSTNAA